MIPLLLLSCAGDSEIVTGCGEDLAVFEAYVWEPVLGKQCVSCHVAGGLAGDSAMVLSPDDLLASLRAASSVTDRLLYKPTGRHPDGHGGGTVIDLESPEYAALTFWVDWTGGTCDLPSTLEGHCFEESAPRRLRRLTHEEYDRTIQDLFGLDLAPGTTFAADPEQDGYINDAASLEVGPLLADQYRAAAEQISWQAPVDLSCDSAEGPTDCAQQQIASLAYRIFRRPITEEELVRYLAFWEQVATEDGLEEGLRWTLAALLQSPHFLYRSELGLEQDAGSYVLTDWERATALSYTFWGTTPDTELMDAAAAGFTEETYAFEVDRLLNHPRARETAADMVEAWLLLDRLGTVSRDGLTSEIRAAMANETRDLVVDIASEGGRLSDLLHARHTFLDPALAAHYGLDGSGRVSLDGVTYGGLLTQGSLLTTHARPTGSSPVHRGVLVRERLLCEHLPPPPPNLDTSPPEVDPTLSTRERYAAHTTIPECASCHEKIDPLGFGFEHYDGLGRFRSEEAGQPVDASGSLDGVPFDGVMELSAALEDDARFRTCFVQSWRRYATGSHACGEDLGDVPLLYPLEELVSLTSFSVRTSEAGEGDTLSVGETGVFTPPEEVPLEEPGSATGGLQLVTTTQWQAGYCADGTVTNDGTTAWTWTVTAPVNGDIYNIWNATVVDDGVDWTFAGVSWNATLQPGASATFGFCADL